MSFFLNPLFSIKRRTSKYFSNLVSIKALALLKGRGLRKLVLILIAQVSLGLLDLAGVALIGLLGTIAISGVQSIPVSSSISEFLELLNLQDKSFQLQMATLAGLASILLIGRTVLSIFLNRKTLFFLATKSAEIAQQTIEKVLNQNLIELKQFSSQEIVHAVTVGINSLVVSIVSATTLLLTDASLLAILGGSLFLFDPLVATSTATLFSVIGIFLYLVMHKRAEKLGREEAELSVLSNEKILEVLSIYREATIRNRKKYYSVEIGKMRKKVAHTVAETAFMPSISKYVIEITLVFGTLAVAILQVATKNVVGSVAILSVFLAAGSRIAPATLRLQQSAVLIKSNAGTAIFTLGILDRLRLVESIRSEIPEFSNSHDEFIPEVVFDSVSFKYPNAKEDNVKTFSLTIRPGSMVAIVGPSGAGKTTLADLLLGVLVPKTGQILISGTPSNEVPAIFPGAIGYVPQEIFIANKSIRENVCLGFPNDASSESDVLKLLAMADLTEFINSKTDKIDYEVGEFGSRLSGGQRQRLGIARALFTNPKLLILDEATSSLDAESENKISKAIANLRGSTTLIVIAHRLSTIMTADKIVYMDQGNILSVGNFEEVRESVADFDNQARLLGL
jgi:ABC-type multidrug transport system fused ATPase/permease subunit